MRYYIAGIQGLSKAMRVLGGTLLTLMMFLTVADVAMRYMGKPFMGAYDLVGIEGAAIIALVFPITTLNDGHVRVDFLLEMISSGKRKGIMAVTKILGIALFMLLGYGLTMKGVEMYRAGEASLTLHVPLAPICFVVGVCCFIEALALIAVLVQGFSKEVSHE